ncbi:hypothetical protein C8A00DRAFT_30792 [Chaetomidium leptoderma]|uniref:Uncharacterized protein n=1 Tax=Chaetomidium leptoderma TaxID=669021 RepID=A0AAN6VRK5_9PEZI|nr:hypothetical protein C8A00DRAFT_30792 [Chaetomidium leptoderma]
MAGPHVLQRDSESGANGNLSTGAIAGIACGAAALFLGAAGLFLVYWRRQRQFDREDNSDGESFDERRPPGAMAPAVTYTMDYKMDEAQHREGDQGCSSSYTYSPEKPPYPFSPLSAPDTASAMPTHPAYIPRALVRGSSTPSNRSTTTNSPFPSPPFPSSSTSHPKTQPDDAVIQAYLKAAAAAQPQDNNNPYRESDSSSSFSGGLPIQPRPPRTRQSPTQIPALVIPPFNSPPLSASSTDGTTTTTTTTTTTASQQPPQPGGGGGSGSSSSQARKPRAYLPPRLQGNKPLSGKENTTISGPLAFPMHYQAPPGGHHHHHGGGGGDDENNNNNINDDDYYFYEDAGPAGGAGGAGGGASDNRRTFRSRALTGGQEDSKGGGKKHGRKRSDRNSGGGGGNRHYAEIEIGRGSDIW